MYRKASTKTTQNLQTYLDTANYMLIVFGLLINVFSMERMRTRPLGWSIICNNLKAVLFVKLIRRRRRGGVWSACGITPPLPLYFLPKTSKFAIYSFNDQYEFFHLFNNLIMFSQKNPLLIHEKSTSRDRSLKNILFFFRFDIILGFPYFHFRLNFRMSLRSTNLTGRNVSQEGEGWRSHSKLQR